MNSFIKVTIEMYNDIGEKSIPDIKLKKEFVHYNNALKYWELIKDIIINLFKL